MIQELKVSLEERKVEADQNKARRLMWEEQRTIFSDITTLEPYMEAYIVAMRAHLAVAAKRMASFNNFGGSKWCNW